MGSGRIGSLKFILWSKGEYFVDNKNESRENKVVEHQKHHRVYAHTHLAVSDTQD